MLKLGIIGCSHGSGRAVRKLLAKYRREGVDAVIVNGDLGDTPAEIRSVLAPLGRVRVPCYVIPGSHEPVTAYRAGMAAVRKRNPRIRDCLRSQRHALKGWDLCFLPGSDWMSVTGGFMLGDDARHLASRLRQFRDAGRRMTGHTLAVLRKAVRRPDKSIIITHVPPRFRGLHAIDVAHYGEATENALILDPRVMKLTGSHLWPAGSRFPLKQAKAFARLGLPLEIRRENVGNAALGRLLRRLRIRKFICAHIHEAGGRGVTRTGKPVRQAAWSRELYYNAGSAREGRGGIYEVADDGRARFRNVRIRP
jgi:hypothetical protein